MLPLNPVEEVKRRLDIVEVVGGYVPLKRAGQNYKALCPFHREKTPSFFVFPERQSWYCFGACGQGGDIFSFIMRWENVSFAEALRLLARRAGVALAPREEGRERLLAANEAAAAFYHRLLLSPVGERARQYLLRRGVDEEAMASFRLGYSPQDWDALLEHLTGQGFTSGELLAAGLLVEGERGPYDRFRGRLMFPIADEEGRVIGFGARALDDEQPKYINTPQTPLFDKGRTLYGLDRAREAIKGEGLAVIVEGYMDVIAAHQQGFRNVVASMGTAITEGQIGLLQRYTRRLALALDADAAGSEATLRGIQVAAQAAERRVVPLPTRWGGIRYREVPALEVKVIPLPQGQDPDQLLRSSPEAWRGLVAEARPVMEHLFALATSRADLSRPQGRSQLIATLLPALAEVGDPVMQAHYLQRLARLARVSERALEDELRAYERRRPAGAEPSPSEGATGDPEEFLLALLLRYPELREQGLALDEGLLLQAENRQVLEAWRRGDLEGGLAPELLPHLKRLQERPLPPWPPAEAARALGSCLANLQRRRLAMAKWAATFALAEREEELGAARALALARAAWQGEGAEEGAAQVATLYLRDIEAGRQLHGRALNLKGEADARAE